MTAAPHPGAAPPGLVLRRCADRLGPRRPGPRTAPRGGRLARRRRCSPRSSSPGWSWGWPRRPPTWFRSLPAAPSSLPGPPRPRSPTTAPVSAQGAIGPTPVGSPAAAMVWLSLPLLVWGTAFWLVGAQAATPAGGARPVRDDLAGPPCRGQPARRAHDEPAGGNQRRARGPRQRSRRSARTGTATRLRQPCHPAAQPAHHRDRPGRRERDRGGRRSSRSSDGPQRCCGSSRVRSWSPFHSRRC